MVTLMVSSVRVEVLASSVDVATIGLIVLVVGSCSEDGKVVKLSLSIAGVEAEDNSSSSLLEGVEVVITLISSTTSGLNVVETSS